MPQLDLHQIIIILSVLAVPMIVAITFHEATHGFIAWRCGDDTAYRMGRVSFNPLRHIDPFGTIILPAAMFISFGSSFGYAKPVPVNFARLRHLRRDMILVAAGGPASNLVLATVSALLLHLVPHSGRDLDLGVLFDTVLGTKPLTPEWNLAWVSAALVYSVLINVALALFNLIPLLPLDGGRVLTALLPPTLARAYARTERFGMLILIGLIFLLPWLGRQMGVDISILHWLLGPASRYLLAGIGHLVGLGNALANI
ncbi:MAG TPA: site-2 protease family protein [Candidatus Cybelea sp.]|nr:site-2 protease family protein [Candidatus Cybelea sp.]